MPGSWNHPDRARQIGQRIHDEVRSALQLLFRQVNQHAIPIRLDTPWTSYLTAIPGHVVPVPLQPPDFAVSSDPVRILRERQPAVTLLNLPQTAILAPDSPCHFEPVSTQEPVFSAETAVSQTVPLDNLRQPPACGQWPVLPLLGRETGQAIPAIHPPHAIQAPIETWTAHAHPLRQERFQQPHTHHSARFYALPVRKAAIPPHRFPLAQREKFRQALAEKAQTTPKNIQLRIVYERMDMSLYSALQQDEQGFLLCTPRAELLGKNRNHPGSRKLLTQHALGSNTYLVFGTRLDTREDIRALVPAEPLQPGFLS